MNFVISSEVAILNKNLKKSSTGWNTCMNKGEYILPKLNIYGIPIANKYLEGKLKNTLVRGWNRVWKFMDSKANDREFFVKKI